MEISASVRSALRSLSASVATDGAEKAIAIPVRAGAPGSSVNGGELLFLALATCYCNDIYREASKLGIAVEQVEVEVTGDFGAHGEPASNMRFRTRVVADAPEANIAALIEQTDRVAEIQNTVRAAIPVELIGYEAVTSTNPSKQRT